MGRWRSERRQEGLASGRNILMSPSQQHPTLDHLISRVRVPALIPVQTFIFSASAAESMPDSFFTSSKSRKRKRTDASAKRRVAPANAAQKKGRRKAADEELSDHTDDDHGIDDLDLRAGRDDELAASGEEDDSETPAQKRLRLAKLYLESVKDDLGLTRFFFLSKSDSRCS